MRLPAPPSGALTGVLVAAAAALPAVAASAQELPQAPFLTTPTGTVQRMLELVEVTARDTVYDLGSGDGRIPIIAAARYGAAAVGIELRRDLVEDARDRAEGLGLGDRVRFVHDDLFDVDLAPATVVTLYLLPSVNLRLRPKLLRELRPGARVASNGFAMGEWSPDLSVRDLENHLVLYGWIVPADVGGRWRLTTPRGREVTLEVAQRFQELRARVVDDAPREGAGGGPDGPEGTAADAAAGARVVGASLRGARLRLELELPDRGRPTVLRGTVSGDTIRGSGEEGRAWSARRLSGSGLPLDRWSAARP